MKSNRYICVSLLTAAVIFGGGCTSSASANLVDTGMSDIKNQEYSNAISNLQKALDSGANKRMCYRGIGIAYMRLGQYDEAIASFENGLKSGSGIIDNADYDMNFYLAQCYYDKGNFDEAIGIYNSILNLHNSDDEAIYLRGLCNLSLGNHDAALADFKSSIAIRPNAYKRVVKMKLALTNAGYEDDGKELLKSVIDTTKMSHYELGMVNFYLGNNADAQNYLEMARTENTAEDKTEVISLLGQTGEKQGDYNYAINVYKTYLEKNGNHADIYNRLGICEMKLADSTKDASHYTAAITDFEAGLKLNDLEFNKALTRNEITAYEYSGDFVSAFNLMNEYLKKWPDDADAQREAVFISTRVTESSSVSGSGSSDDNADNSASNASADNGQ